MMNEAGSTTSVLVRRDNIYSIFLQRNVVIDFYLPAFVGNLNNIDLLLINDGQDLPVMPFAPILDELYTSNIIAPLLCVGLHCGEERRMEYGTANYVQYKGFGAKAGLYSMFVMDELLPLIKKTYNIQTFKSKSFSGFSLGGLSALDIVFNYPQEFAFAGIFSGSLWWRSKSYGPDYNDATDRIMHRQVREKEYFPWLQFFFECGALDELADRNNNGIIDSIDDTQDLIKELRIKGYANSAIKYLELPDGMHNVATWASAFPEFLIWAFGKKENGGL